MKKLFVLLGVEKDIIFILVLIALFFLSAKDIMQWRIFPYLNERTMDLIEKMKERKRRRIA